MFLLGSGVLNKMAYKNGKKNKYIQASFLSGFSTGNTATISSAKTTRTCIHPYCNSRSRHSQYCDYHSCNEITCGNDKNCPIHVCHIDYCTGDVVYGSKYCKSHKCEKCPNSKKLCKEHSCIQKYCDWTRSGSSKYCKSHKCQRCDNYGASCPIHICRVDGCSYYNDKNSPYCDYHKCPVYNCNQLKGKCTDHTCRQNHCNGTRVEHSYYCKYDKCARNDCFLERKCPIHSCQHVGCWQQKNLEDDRYCKYHKCIFCPQSKALCKTHKCKKCHNQPMAVKYISPTYVGTDYCGKCVCTVYNCTEPTVECRSKTISKTYCQYHAPRCLDCGDIATYLSFHTNTSTYIFCHKHKACQICKHKPRNPFKTICDNHWNRETMFPELYPKTDISKIKGYCLADGKFLFAKLYHQTTNNQYNIIPRVLSVEFDESKDESNILRQVILTFSHELFIEFQSFLGF